MFRKLAAVGIIKWKPKFLGIRVARPLPAPSLGGSPVPRTCRVFVPGFRFPSTRASGIAEHHRRRERTAGGFGNGRWQMNGSTDAETSLTTGSSRIARGASRSNRIDTRVLTAGTEGLLHNALADIRGAGGPTGAEIRSERVSSRALLGSHSTTAEGVPQSLIRSVVRVPPPGNLFRFHPATAQPFCTICE